MKYVIRRNTTRLALVATAAVLAIGAKADTAAAAFPGANGSVLFDDVVTQDTDDDGNADVFTPVVGRIEADGSKSILASGLSATTTEQAVAADPASDAMGQQIAYVKGTEIWLMANDGSGQRFLVANGREPAWSRDGSRIVFTRGPVTGSELYSVEVGTGADQQLTTGGDSRQAAWSPVGDEIAFTRGVGFGRQIFVMPAPAVGAVPVDPATGAQLLTNGHSPAWSPDGLEVVFAAGGSINNISKLPVADPSLFSDLTAIDVDNTSPAWSPDGQRIVFARNGRALTVSSSGGAFQQPVLLADGVGANLDWAPAAALPPANTPTGSPVVVSLPLVTLTFANVTTAGTSRVTANVMSPPIPNGFQLLGVVYDITTTAVFDPNPGVEVCIESADPAAQLRHWNGAGWINVTTRATATHVCGQVSSLSPFALFLAADTVPPVLSLPANFAVDATSPAGAAVAYVVSASDVVDPSPAVHCAPASGSIFAIGAKTVACTATDAAGNTSSGSFVVTVRGAPAQIVALAQKTLAMLNQPPLEAALRAQLENAAAALIAKNKTAACRAMSLYIAAVRLQSGRALTAAQAAELVADAQRIKAVIGC